jgi:hypothetical protein
VTACHHRPPAAGEQTGLRAWQTSRP